MKRAVVVGGGHNGLVTAFYLAQSKKFTVEVFERRDIIGGACVTEEFHPGFRNSTASYSVGLLSPQVIRDMDLKRHGYTFVRRSGGHFVPQEDGTFFETSNLDPSVTRRSLARTGDEKAWDDWHARLEPFVPLMLDIINNPAPQAGPALSDTAALLRRAATAARLTARQRADLWEVLTRPISELLEDAFRGDAVKGMLAFDAITGSHRSLRETGGGVALLHHILGQANDARVGEWGHSKGGMGGITMAMKRACEEQGVKVHLQTNVAAVCVENGKATGIKLASGEVVKADVVMGAVHPRTLFLDMVDASAYARDEHSQAFHGAIRRYGSGSGTLRMNVALSELPKFSACKGDAEAEKRACLTSVIIAPSLSYIEKAYLESRTHGFARRPCVEMLFPTMLDDSLAPPGKHIASLFCQHFDYDWDGWNDTTRQQAADAVIDTVTSFAPNFRSAILGKMVLGPRDLEARFGLVKGDIFHGYLTLAQMMSARPAVGWARNASPIQDLYLCASGAHPGGGVTGIPGKLAAQSVLQKH